MDWVILVDWVFRLPIVYKMKQGRGSLKMVVLGLMGLVLCLIAAWAVYFLRFAQPRCNKLKQYSIYGVGCVP